ncbi:MAG: arsenate reductase ArsC [Gemmataceae bacterium]
MGLSRRAGTRLVPCRLHLSLRAGGTLLLQTQGGGTGVTGNRDEGSQSGRSPRESVLFLCSANSARSQMAEAILRKYAADRFDAYTVPASNRRELHPLTVAVMREAGIDVSGQRAKSVKEFLGRIAAHHAIFVCDRAERMCPVVWPGALSRLYWPFDDPALKVGSEEERLAKFRDVRDQIER